MAFGFRRRAESEEEIGVVKEANTFKNVLFDLDGTLTDPQVGITQSIVHALTESGIVAPAAKSLRWCIGPPLRESLEVLLQTVDRRIIDQSLVHYRNRFSVTGLFENSVYDGVAEALESIVAQGIRLFVATSKPQVFALRIIEHFDLARYFSGVYGSDLDGRLSDKIELIRHILNTERLEAERTIMIGDRKYDIIGGQRNKVATAAVTYGYGEREELAEVGPDFFFDSPAEIAGFFAAQS